MKTPLNILTLTLVFLLISCNKEDDQNNNPANEDTLLQNINNRFTFTPNQNFEALYLCARRNSNLAWYFNFHTNGTFDVLFTTDTNQDFSFQGTYTYTNNQLTLQMNGGPNMPFPNGLNETSTVIMPQFGVVAAFATSEMIAICVGHGLNTQQPPRINADYACQDIIQAATREENVIELVHRTVPTSFAVLGSTFRQKDIWVDGAANPIIRRGYGIYRQVGNEFYASFRIASDFADFAQGQLPFDVGIVNPPFDDFNVLSGRIESSGQQLIIDQLPAGENACIIR